MNFLSAKQHAISKDDHWIPLSDLMTGLMMTFMLLALVFMVKVDQEAALNKQLRIKAEEQANRMQYVAILYKEMRSDLHEALATEFKNDLPRWGAELDQDLTIRFREPEVLFDSGRSELKPRFTEILDDFFPRYVRILGDSKYRNSIEEVRIEGHTSSHWMKGASNELDAYFKNMELSQARTRSTLQYLLTRTEIFGYERFIKSLLTANGLSSSKIRLNPDKTENERASQRVEFRVRTNADARMAEILSASQQ